MYFSSQILRHSSGDFDDIMLTDVYIFVYTYTCNNMRSVMLQINEYDDDDDDNWHIYRSSSYIKLVYLCALSWMPWPFIYADTCSEYLGQGLILKSSDQGGMGKQSMSVYPVCGWSAFDWKTLVCVFVDLHVCLYYWNDL